MPINDMGEAVMPIGQDALAAPEFPEETGEKRKKNRLVVTAGPLGAQLTVIPTLELYPEEEDPNP